MCFLLSKLKDKALFSFNIEIHLKRSGILSQFLSIFHWCNYMQQQWFFWKVIWSDYMTWKNRSTETFFGHILSGITKRLTHIPSLLSGSFLHWKWFWIFMLCSWFAMLCYIDSLQLVSKLPFLPWFDLMHVFYYFSKTVWELWTQMWIEAATPHF